MSARIDGVGNVIGRYAAADPAAKALMVGSHYDTVINAGNYDGRLGILTGLVVVEHLNHTGQRLPFHLDLIGFAEEEGVRFSPHYIGSSAIAGRFDRRVLMRRDGRAERRRPDPQGGLRSADNPRSLARRPEEMLGYLEVHIEQGPVLLQADLPVGIVTSIAGTAVTASRSTAPPGMPGRCRCRCAATPPPPPPKLCCMSKSAARTAPTLVGTVGRLMVPNGAINVIPGRCELSLDIRAGDDATRMRRLPMCSPRSIASRGAATSRPRSRKSSDGRGPALRACRPVAAAIARAGIRRVFCRAGPDMTPVMFGGLTDLGMLFVRCGNGGISHSPLETVTAADADLGARVLLDVLEHYEEMRIVRGAYHCIRRSRIRA